MGEEDRLMVFVTSKEATKRLGLPREVVKVFIELQNALAPPALTVHEQYIARGLVHCLAESGPIHVAEAYRRTSQILEIKTSLATFYNVKKYLSDQQITYEKVGRIERQENRRGRVVVKIGFKERYKILSDPRYRALFPLAPMPFH